MASNSKGQRRTRPKSRQSSRPPQRKAARFTPASISGYTSAQLRRVFDMAMLQTRDNLSEEELTYIEFHRGPLERRYLNLFAPPILDALRRLPQSNADPVESLASYLDEQANTYDPQAQFPMKRPAVPPWPQEWTDMFLAKMEEEAKEKNDVVTSVQA